MSFAMNHLSDIEFEHFCFDLLRSLDFVNLSWRKGTGLNSSPADQGRDIQGEMLKRDIDGSEHHERWFVECKHYSKGVPPEKLQGAIAWANAERPDVLLIVTSSFLSNPAKNYLEQFRNQNRPPYRLKVWELTNLENLTAGKTDLRRRYGLPTDLPFVALLNTYHIIYAMKPQLNTVEYFLELMDSLDPDKRDRAFADTYSDIVRPRFREAVTGDEKVVDLKINPDDYATFRSKCLNPSEEASSPLFVHRIVSCALAWLFHLADKTGKASQQNRIQVLIDLIKADVAKEKNDDRRAALGKMLELPTTTLKELPERIEKFYNLYTYICDELVRKLLAEKP